MKMRWVHLLLMTLALHNVLAEGDETNELSAPPKLNLDSNLRRALLKALTELENEDKRNDVDDDGQREKTIQKAFASSVSIFANGEAITATPSSTTTASTTTTTEKALVHLQKSEGIQHPTITTIERDSEDPELILTSASNSFSNQPSQKSIQDEKAASSNLNSIQSTTKDTTKLKRVDTTTLAPTVTTDESEAKVENVQFFSAPLVAAFTVHQDELGQPNKVEAIYKPVLSKKVQEEVISAQRERLEQEKLRQIQQQQEQERLKLEELRRQQTRQQQQYQQEQKQKALEQEIFRLNLNLKQQEQLFLRQQEELRARVNAQSFLPSFNNNGHLNQQQVQFRPDQQFTPSNVAVQPSLTFDPLLEAGKLPLNAQVLPIRGPVNFHTPFVAPLFNNFNQQPQNNRFFRQNSGTGNFGVNDFKNTNSFAIQQSLQPGFDNSGQSNRFFRSNGESTLTSPQFVQTPQPQSNRFFRSNLESSFGSPSNSFYNPQANNNYQLSNLLQNSGAFRGKSPEDLNLISKVLSLNHVGNDFESSVRQQQKPYVRTF